MNPLPPPASLSFLRGLTLYQVCIGCNEAILHFDDDVGVTIEVDIVFFEPNGETRQLSPRESAGQLAAFLGQRVTDYDVVDARTLDLRFETGRMRIQDETRHNESFQIRHGRELFVV
jgi:hypothetical protein